jgi:Flp pilus assembly protein TadG
MPSIFTRSTRQRTGLRAERGEELVEFALGSTLLFMMIFLVIEGGIMVWRYNMLSNFAQEGARWAAVRGSKSATAFKTTGTKTNLTNYLQGKDPAVSVSFSPNVDSNTLLPGDSYTVTVTRPMPSTVAFFTMSGNMAASASMRIAR